MSRLTALLVVTGLVLVRPAAAQGPTDEIQVYDAGITAPGKFNLTLHTNFTPDGLGAAAFPGAIVSNHSFDGGFEWAYGATPWLELGLYLPIYSVTSAYGATVDGGKLRLLFVSPHADDRRFFYGANFEFSYNSARWDARRYTSEIRPIVGWHLHPWDFVFNPILDNSWDGGVAALEFDPAARVAYNIDDRWAVAAEEYAGFGPLREFVPASQQVQQAWAVVDRHGALDVEAGVGFGLTAASDRMALKLMFSRDLN
ncbi:MAG: hypothetical protein KGJ70_13665 [Gemmatimonadota bacterium]|nr:hypothetical protein [Gemmatimonadota bacterium]